jgi:type II secretory pathway pseudopilin PulG
MNRDEIAAFRRFGNACRSQRSGDSNQSGFTLVELAIVLICVALLLVGLLGPLRTQMEARDRQRAQEDLEEIKEALLGHAVSQARLPCPDCANNAGGCAGGTANDGLEDMNGNVCRTNEGNIPFATLGVAEFDPWGSFYHYRVRTEGGVNFADIGAAGPNLPNCPIPPARATINLCDAGNITVRNQVGGAVIAQNIPALILSYGANRTIPALAIGGTFSNDELENQNADPNFVLKTFSREDALEFDDLVSWVPLNVLQTKMVNAGLLP